MEEVRLGIQSFLFNLKRKELKTFVIGILFFSIGIIILNSKYTLFENFSFFLRFLENENNIYGFIFLITGFFIMSIIYLQSSSPLITNWEEIKDSNNPISQKVSKEEQKSIIDNLQKEIKDNLLKESFLTKEEKEKLANELKKDIEKNITDEQLLAQANILRESIEKETHLKHFENQMIETKNRLLQEVRSLKLRANMNLLVGIIITGLGLYVLWDMIEIVKNSSFIAKAIEDKDNTIFYKQFIFDFVPRIFLVIFIELFAYFFLKLYKGGLDEIKFFQNELTNIDAKYLALSSALILPNKSEILDKIIYEMGKTERNYILEKGQTTVELERARSEGENTKNIMNSLPEIFTSFKEKK